MTDRAEAERADHPGGHPAGRGHGGVRQAWGVRVQLGGREIGHLHGDRVAHSGLPREVWSPCFDQGRIDYHRSSRAGRASAPQHPERGGRRRRDRDDRPQLRAHRRRHGCPPRQPRDALGDATHRSTTGRISSSPTRRAQQSGTGPSSAPRSGRLAVPGGKPTRSSSGSATRRSCLADEFPDLGVLDLQLSVGGTATVLHFSSDDVDASGSAPSTVVAEVRQPLQDSSGVSATGRSPSVRPSLGNRRTAPGRAARRARARRCRSVRGLALSRSAPSARSRDSLDQGIAPSFSRRHTRSTCSFAASSCWSSSPSRCSLLCGRSRRAGSRRRRAVGPARRA